MAVELTPCGALFETMKRYGGISHKDLARLVLSGRPLADGKSPLSRSDDRTWVSRFIVHAPVGSLQDRYFSDWGVAALRVCARLRSSEGKKLSARGVLDVITGPGGDMMRQALRGCAVIRTWLCTTTYRSAWWLARAIAKRSARSWRVYCSWRPAVRRT